MTLGLRNNLKHRGKFLGGFTPSTAEYQAVYDARVNKPPDAWAAAQNTYVKTLVDAGLWTDDLFYVPENDVNTAGESAINWANPGTYDLVEVANGGALTWTAKQGYKTDGLAYLRTNWIAATNGVNYAALSASLSTYLTNHQNANDFICGAQQFPNYMYLNANGAVTVNANDIVSQAPGGAVDGWRHATRLNGTDINAYLNALTTNGAAILDALPTRELFLLCSNSGGTPTNFLSTLTTLGSLNIGLGYSAANLATRRTAHADYLTAIAGL